MKKTFVWALVAFSSLAFNMLHAQYSLSGTVNGSDNVGLEDANVYLLRVADTSLVKTALTETDGSFEFTGLQAGNVFVVVKQIDHLSHSSEAVELGPDQPAIVLPPIQLQGGKETQLETVQIVGKIPLVERKIDRTIVNVDAMITAAGGTAMDALEKSPGVSVDQNGGIRLKGKSGVIVFIDDKPTYMSGTDLENYLRSLPASTIKQIELMTNPPAKYDAAGNAGVINIKTKKNNIQGINGGVTLNYGQGRYSKTNNSLNLNYRRNKLNLFTTLSGGQRNIFQDLYIDRIYLNADQSPQSYFGQRSYIKRSMSNGNARIGVDYYASEKTTIGLVVNGAWLPSQNSTDNIASVLDEDQVLASTVLAANLAKTNFRNGGLNLNFRHQFDSTGKSLTVDGDYVGYASDEEHVFQNYVYTPSGTLTYQDRLDGTLPSDIRIIAFKADYSHPLRSGLTFGGGIKGSLTTTDNAVEYVRTVDGVSEVDYSISNHFLYDEKIFAAYVNASKEWDRFGFQAGLRAESTRSLGNQLGNALQPATEFNRQYDNLFPTAYLSYKLDSAANHQLVLDYGKRIDRPFFQDLNPFLSPLDKFTFYSGNPYLKPSFVHAVSLTHAFKGILNTTVSYSRSSGEINETLEIVNGIYYSRPGNIGRTEVMNIAVDANINFAKWLTTNAYVEAGRTHYVSKLYTQKLDAAGNYIFLRAMNMFQFGKGWSGELSGEFMSRFVSAQVTTGGVGFTSIGLRKNILHDKGSLKLSLSDVFYTREFKGVINNLSQTTATYHSTVDSRVLACTFSYRFGKSLGEQRKHNGGSADSEKNRVKG
ncbi:MAG TPA: TonB-dependent receptor [Bacteroidia bacterium]|nr:TonB-dependent receptor [Bacteroidia bacterium]